MVEYSDSEFKKKLKFLTVSQKAIQSLSTWCLERHEHYKSIITIWSNTIKKVKIKKRLLLFYLANHVIQYSKRHNYKFVDRWKIAIQKAIPYVRDEEILSKISRVIKIWKERHVYNHSYLADLTGLLTTQNQKLKLADPVQGCQACFKNAEKVKLLQKKLKSFISSMPTDYRLPSPDINQSFSSTSSMSIEDLNMYNINYDTVLNSDNIDSIYNTDIYVPTTINNIKSCITPEKTITDQELYDPASVSIPTMEIDDQQPLTIQFPDTPSPPPDETFTNYNNKSSIYSTSSDEDYVHTPMSFTDQFTTSEVSINMAPLTNSSSVINENIIPVSYVPQPGLDVTVHNDGSSNDTPASNYKGIGIDHCALASKITDKDEIVTPEMINKMSVIDHRNLISLTHSFHNSSPTASDYQAFSNSIIQPPKLNLLMKSIIKSQNNLDNLESVDMDLSDSQNHSVPLLPPLPPPFQPPVKPPPPPLPMPTSTPPQSPLSLPSPMIPPTPLPMSKSMHSPLPPPYSPPIKPPPPPPPPPPIKPYTPTLMPPRLSQPMKPPMPLPMSTSTQPPLPPPLQPPIKPPPPPLPPQMIQPTPPPPMLTLLSQPMPISMLPPLPLPMNPSTLPPMPTSIPSYFYSPFNLVYKSVPDVTYQLEQSSKPWRKDRPSLNKIQSNKEQLSQCYSKFVSNQPQTQWPIHVQGIKSTKDFMPNGKDIYFSSRDPRKFNRHSTPVGTLNQESFIGSEKSNLNCRKIEEPAPTPLNRK